LNAPILLALLAAGAAGAWLAWRGRRRARRARLRAQPLPADAIRLLDARLQLHRHMPEAQRRELHGHINVFLDEKRFVGCGGFEVTEEVRLTVAAWACLLLLGGRSDYYPGFTTILVYPGAFIAPEVVHDDLVEIHEAHERSGESWPRGPVVLSWEDVEEGAAAAEDGYNVVLHEFAHKLDEENEGMDGLPVLDDPEQYRRWAAVLGREYASLKQAVRRGHHGVLDDYGIESPSEFFAVATEAFFVRPLDLEDEHPELYAQMTAFYRVDPARWLGSV
jgi:Mlc titration factor MtfA (ptsG expression regulator)